jgi:hypothetical protein
MRNTVYEFHFSNSRNLGFSNQETNPRLEDAATYLVHGHEGKDEENVPPSTVQLRRFTHYKSTCTLYIVSLYTVNLYIMVQ